VLNFENTDKKPELKKNLVKMAHVSKVPVSRVIKEDEEPEAASRSRGDYKKMRELEEARKSGSEPAAQDEFGKDINPHIPQYISEAPWYLDPKVSFIK
jgi:hypothetical protein